MAQRLPLVLLAAACPSVLAALFAGGRGGAGWLFAAAALVVPAALIALAGGRRAWPVAAAVAALLIGGGWTMLGLAGGERIGGLPGSAWAMFAAFWGIPLVVTAWAYALTFPDREKRPPG